MARPISKITSSILALKKGQQVVMPRGAKRATIASYVYNANKRVGVANQFSTCMVKKSGRNHVAVQFNAG